MSLNMFVDMDAWSDGQMKSKLWLCHELEQRSHNAERKQVIWIYGAWYGLLAFLLLSREKIKIREIHLFDLDPEVLKVAKKILNHWEVAGLNLQFHCRDCNSIESSDWLYQNNRPDWIINTSCEHFEGQAWLAAIPPGVNVVAQSTDMVHKTHINSVAALSEFKGKLKSLQKLDYQGELGFSYPDKSFKRFMLIGQK